MLLVLAAGEMPHFIAPLALIVVASAVVAWVSQRVGLVPIVGFLLAGVVIGPNALGLVTDIEVVEAAAEVGVILLLFTIGIEFSLARLNRIRRLVLGGGALTVALATAVVAGLVVLLDQGLNVGIYTGLLVSVSSTAVVLSLLSSRNATSSDAGQLSVAVLIFEDIAVVAMVLVVPMLGSTGGSALDILQALGISALVIATVLGLATRLMPRLLNAIARTCSTEVFLLAVIGICFGTAYVTGLLGVSVSLGAFLAGLMVSESRFGTQALSEVLPLQIIFTAVFFLSIGMLLDPGFLIDNLGYVLLAIAAVLVIKTVTGTIAAAAVGVALPVAISSSLMRAQIGEFSFVLEQSGRSAGLTPLGEGDAGVQTFLAASVLLMALTPVLAPLGDRLGAFAGGLRHTAAPAMSESTAGEAQDRHDHVVVSGWGPGARHVAGDLRALQIPHVVVTLNPDGAAEAHAAGHPVVIGDITKDLVLHEAGVAASHTVVIGDDDPERAMAIASVIREHNAAATVVVRAMEDMDVHEAARAGIARLVVADRASTQQLAKAVRHAIGVAGDDGRTVIDPSQLVTVPRAIAAGCDHATSEAVLQPSSPGCEDCLRMGMTTWVHLRMCAGCGHMGCCDSSPGRHATAHHTATQHPVMQSMEPGESWLWCFVDGVTLLPAGTTEPVG